MMKLSALLDRRMLTYGEGETLAESITNAYSQAVLLRYYNVISAETSGIDKIIHSDRDERLKQIYDYKKGCYRRTNKEVRHSDLHRNGFLPDLSREEIVVMRTAEKISKYECKYANLKVIAAFLGKGYSIFEEDNTEPQDFVCKYLTQADLNRSSTCVVNLPCWEHAAKIIDKLYRMGMFQTFVAI